MPLVKHDIAQLYYEVYGSGPPRVILHGVGGNMLVWWQQIP
jgi:pimeloyl-ACP methyl ester carboxylesterase